jgi:hypothetical protein
MRRGLKLKELRMRGNYVVGGSVAVFLLVACGSGSDADGAGPETVAAQVQALESCEVFNGLAGAGPNDPEAQLIRFSDGPSYSGTFDATMAQASPDANFGNELYVQAKGGSNQRHGLLRWDVSSIPELTTIQAACIRLQIMDPSGSAYPFYEVYGTWFEAQVTWRRENNRSSWQVPGAWGANDSGATVVAAIPANTQFTAWLPLSTELVQRWIHFKDQNQGILIGNDHSYDGVSFASSEAPTLNDRPQLVIRR